MRRPLGVTPHVASTTAAALNAEQSAHRLKEALLPVRTEPLLNTQAAHAKPAPRAFDTPQKPTCKHRFYFITTRGRWEAEQCPEVPLEVCASEERSDWGNATEALICMGPTAWDQTDDDALLGFAIEDGLVRIVIVIFSHVRMVILFRYRVGKPRMT
ncbi:hypothetical protein EDB83DRAFT_2593303 [Lactarius deliciosus]|nr:hypothetical protein EDB83DRAFT_2593303 [Lactarius deliciosus]